MKSKRGKLRLPLIQLLEEIVFLAVNLTWQPIAQILDVGLILYLIGKYGIKWLESTNEHSPTPVPSSLEDLLNNLGALRKQFHHREEVLAYREQKIEERLAQVTQLIDRVQSAKKKEMEPYIIATMQDRTNVRRQQIELHDNHIPALELLYQEIENAIIEEKTNGLNPSPEQLQQFQLTYEKLMEVAPEIN
jgi:hypothetical protein